MATLTNGAAELAKNACHKADDTTAFVTRMIANQLIKNPMVDQVAKTANVTIDAGKQVYSKIKESPVTEQIAQWTGSTVGSIAGATSKVASGTVDVGKLAYQNIADSPILRFTAATLASAFTVNLWKTALASPAARRALRAACIHNSIRIYSWLYLPPSLRAVAVASGVRANYFIISGIGPGLFIACATYDLFRIAQFVYEKYHEHYMPSKL